MKFNRLKAACCMVLGMAMTGTAFAESSQYYSESVVDNQSVNSPYRFDYVVSGPDAARPIQVYSDGYETYFEFEKGVKPSYATVGDEKIKFKYSKPYYSISGEYENLTVRTSRGKIEVERRENSQLANSVSSRKSYRSASNLGTRAAFTLPGGVKLSEALADFARSYDWVLKWNVDVDYMIEEPIPMQEDFFGAIYDLIKTYQDQGGMQGTIPRFSAANRVVSIEKLDNTQR